MVKEPQNGWIKLHRKILDWEWFDDGVTFHVFIYLLLKANVEDKKWHGLLIKRGQLITSQPHISAQLSNKHHKTTIQQVRTALDKLKATGELTVETTNAYSIISINNYGLYQQDNRQKTNKQHASQQSGNRQVTTTKEYKEYKEERIDITPEDVEKLSNELGISQTAVLSFYKKIKNYELSTGKKYKNYPATIRIWVGREVQKGAVLL